MGQIEWNLLVVNYLFLAGLSAGAFAISSFATYIGGPHFRRVAQTGSVWVRRLSRRRSARARQGSRARDAARRAQSIRSQRRRAIARASELSRRIRG